MSDLMELWALLHVGMPNGTKDYVGGTVLHPQKCSRPWHCHGEVCSLLDPLMPI